MVSLAQQLEIELQILKDRLELLKTKIQSVKIDLIIFKWLIEQQKCITDLKCKYEV